MMKAKWKAFVKEKSSPVERKFLGQRFQNRELLIRALTRNALLNEVPPFLEMRTLGSQTGLDTVGNTVLDFVIIDHFSKKPGKVKNARIPEGLTELRKIYGNNLALHQFAKQSMKLQKYIFWGSDEITRTVWEDPKTELLADCFEALLGAIYLDKGMKGVMKFFKKIQFFKAIDKTR